MNSVRDGARASGRLEATTSLCGKPAAKEAKQTPKPHLEGLHSLRGWAALSIVVFHIAGISKLPLPEELSFVTRYLGQGVPLFFVVSAFSLFLSTMGRVGTPDWLGAYVIRRIFRIAPLFYTMVIFYSFFLPLKYGATVSVKDLLLNVTFLFNLVPAKYESIVWAGWTIGVEMLFYVLVPYLLIFTRTGLHAAILLVVSVIISCLFFDLYQSPAPMKKYAYMSLPGSLGIFAFGIVAYFTYKRLVSLSERARTKISLGLLAAAFCALIVILRYENDWISVARNRSHLWGIFFALLVVSQSLKPSPILSGKGLAWLGNLSFGLYLCHPPLISTLKPAYQAFYELPVWQGVSFSLCVGLTLVLLIPIAYLAGRLIEQPFIRIGERLIHSRQQAVTRSTPSQLQEHGRGDVQQIAPPLVSSAQ